MTESSRHSPPSSSNPTNPLSDAVTIVSAQSDRNVEGTAVHYSSDNAPAPFEMRATPQSWLSAAWKAEFCLWFTALSWGANLLVVKSALAQLNPWVFNASRLTLATIVLGVLAWLESRYRPRSATPLKWHWFFLFAFLNGFLYQVVFFLGISRTTAGNTALLLSSMPMWTAIFSFLFVFERLPVTAWLGLGVTFVGTLFVLLQNPTIDFSAGYLLGNTFILCGAMTWAGATVVSRPLLQTISPLRLAFLSSLITMPLHYTICAPFLPESMQQLLVPANALAILYSGLISTGIAYATWHYGVRQLGGSRAGVYQNVVTLVAVVGGWIFLSEPMLVAQYIGGAAIILGVVLMRLKRT
ncbi:MAG: DMT family transporter [Planctomycetaceae bacterium]|nr:DMT family transporter [Planctomycetaceae bacterium]